HPSHRNNIAVALVGRKEFTLYHPSDGENLYVNGKYDPGTSCCDVDPYAPDLARHPRFAKARPAVVVLEPTDGLFVPRYFWH
ncbi:cupin-like domain-containing protein, partial [Xanthomonas citri pv. citri]|nr:cupin-like domain-containing protein [Xanthomonas citri pv. citri]